MHLSDAVEKGYGFAHKIVQGNRYRVTRSGDVYLVFLEHRSGVKKLLNGELYLDGVARRYGSDGWKPGM